MNEQQQELYEKLLKKVNEFCLGQAAEDVIEAIDALVDNYERVNHLPKDKYKVARELLNDTSPLQALKTIILGTNIDTYRSSVEEIDNAIAIIETALKETEKIKKCYKNELKNVSYYNNLALKYKKALEIIKEHRLDIDWFLQFVKQDISYQHYVYCVEQSNNAFAKRFLLNDEQYELLKEVLL